MHEELSAVMFVVLARHNYIMHSLVKTSQTCKFNSFTERLIIAFASCVSQCEWMVCCISMQSSALCPVTVHIFVTYHLFYFVCVCAGLSLSWWNWNNWTWAAMNWKSWYMSDLSCLQYTTSRRWSIPPLTAQTGPSVSLNDPSSTHTHTQRHNTTGVPVAFAPQ